MEILAPKPPRALVVCGDWKYSGLWREALAQVRLWKPPLQQNHSPERKKRPDVVNHPGSIPQLGDFWRITHQNHFNSTDSAGERESKTDDKIEGWENLWKISWSLTPKQDLNHGQLIPCLVVGRSLVKSRTSYLLPVGDEAPGAWTQRDALNQLWPGVCKAIFLLGDC